MKWFGESWGAPVCDPDEKVETPDAPCEKCGEAIRAGDQGVILPIVLGSTVWRPAAYHLDCFMRALGIDPDH